MRRMEDTSFDLPTELQHLLIVKSFSKKKKSWQLNFNLLFGAQEALKQVSSTVIKKN